MIYVINDKIYFNHAENMVWGDEGNRIIIPRFSSEILALFLANNDKALSRDFMLTEVWEARALNGSNNNLNNYVSILRRKLSLLGGDNLIITIPKYGFSFTAGSIEKIASEILPSDDAVNLYEVESNEDVTPEHEDVHLPNDEASDLEKAKKPTVVAGHSASVRHSFFHPIFVKITLIKMLIVSIIAIIVSLILFHVFCIGSYFTSRDLVVTKIKDIGLCQAFVINESAQATRREDLIAGAERIIMENNINCSQYAKIYYSKTRKRDIAGGRVRQDTLSYCPDAPHYYCENFYYSERKI
ncbi:winged helix-turn-helix domain-containing protein [Serratia fonticola]|uniref:winged helix-turn-helix domain-containing protein n=1 Tax=Serratia fonticola TaxID=47917 RepID=UPI0027E9F7A1|nr:winged helix-turn-helix domain-containing protein [Serratia fonticola]MDQ7211981.1 winged helix-turn-helix domain-containing protein [Serratia fonticola]HBE9081971.1 winged helix-turn-helix domain-containing protein [Serratia fonticola]HBE9092601.1 winged helix-turn-helix domain-containing protein [Serratia fonticola]